MGQFFYLYIYPINTAKRPMDEANISKDDLPEPNLTENSEEVLKRRYLKTNQNGDPAEKPKDMFFRVAKAIAKEEEKYDDSPWDVEDLTIEFYKAMSQGIFEPNSPTLFNAGRDLGQLSACFVLPIEDSMVTEDETGIMDTLRNAAIIHKSGGGTGFAFSNLRPKGSRVGSTGGVSSGPVSFMEMYDAMTEQVKQGGHRRGANMGILRIDHPDILDFIHSKTEQGEIENFNISVAVTDEFMEAVKNGDIYKLDHPNWDGDPVTVDAKRLFNEIVKNAWKNGEPGLFFIDEANRYNPVPHLGDYKATNPCGEQPLLPFDVCNLGSLNLSKFVIEEDYRGERDPVCNVDWLEMSKYIHLAVRFLDNVIDANNYPLDRILKLSDAIRRIGFGPMGLADMLVKLGLPYDSKEGKKFTRFVADFIRTNLIQASMKLAEERNIFPQWKDSIWGPDEFCARDENGDRVRPARPLRNANINTVAPTGTISIIAGCSGGIEPLYAVAFMRNQAGTMMPDVNDDFVEIAKQEGFYNEELMRKIAEEGTIDFPSVPDWVVDLFRTADQIDPSDHIDMQAICQEYTDSAISKTINFSSEATVEDVKEGYLQAYEQKCKGVTVYRDGSRDGQVLSTGKTESSSTELAGNGCPECGEEMVHTEGCVECPSCNYSACTM